MADDIEETANEEVSRPEQCEPENKTNRKKGKKNKKTEDTEQVTNEEDKPKDGGAESETDQPQREKKEKKKDKKNKKKKADKENSEQQETGQDEGKAEEEVHKPEGPKKRKKEKRKKDNEEAKKGDSQRDNENEESKEGHEKAIKSDSQIDNTQEENKENKEIAEEMASAEKDKKEKKKKKKDKESGDSEDKKKKKKEKKREDKVNTDNIKKEEINQNGNKPTLSDESYEKVLKMAATFARVSALAREHNMKISKINNTLTWTEEVLNQLEVTQNKYQYIWKIENFNDHFMAARSGQKKAIYCPEVESHHYGYKLGITLCPNGDGVGLNTHMSLFFCILKGKYDEMLPWPFSCALRFSLLDQRRPKKNKPRDNIVGIFIPNSSPANEPFLGKPVNARNRGLGLPRFAHLETIFKDEDKYIVDDTIFIKIEIDLNGLETRMDN